MSFSKIVNKTPTKIILKVCTVNWKKFDQESGSSKYRAKLAVSESSGNI
jgi:hypothetical protein